MRILEKCKRFKIKKKHSYFNIQYLIYWNKMKIIKGRNRIESVIKPSRITITFKISSLLESPESSREKSPEIKSEKKRQFERKRIGAFNSSERRFRSLGQSKR